MKKNVRYLSIIASLCAIISTCVGLFYSFGGARYTVQNIYGQEIELFGDGIYANNSLMKVGATKGTDVVMLVIAISLLLVSIFFYNRKWAELFTAGLQCCLLYASTCLIMGVSFNRLYPVYLILFSTVLFAFAGSILSLRDKDCFEDAFYDKKMKGTAVFMMVGGCSVLVWLTFLIPAVTVGDYSGFIEIYTTEPTFAIDLGIILPSCLTVGVGLLRRRKRAYAYVAILLNLIICVGACVILQTVFQLGLGIELTIGQIVGMVASFVVLGIIAIVLNIRLMRHVKEWNK